MLTNFHALGAGISIKVHYLFSHLVNFPENLSDLSEEQGGAVSLDIKLMEERYQGRLDSHMMANYCWSLMRNYDQQSHKQKLY